MNADQLCLLKHIISNSLQNAYGHLLCFPHLKFDILYSIKKRFKKRNTSISTLNCQFFAELFDTQPKLFLKKIQQPMKGGTLRRRMTGGCHLSRRRSIT